MPQISVIVPVYKVEPYLHKCVDSILVQTFTDFELILIDDGSPDNCGNICDEYAEKDSRVKVIHQKNGGLSAARNAGLDWVFANSSSEWIAFVDSDDYVAENYLELLYEAATENNADLAMCGFKRVDDKDKEIEGSIYFADSVANKVESFQLIADYPWTVVAWGKLYKRELFDNIRYPIGKISEDEFVIHKILCKTEKVALNSNQSYYYVDRKESLTNTHKLSNYLDAFEGQFKRYLFCEKHNLPFDTRLLEIQFVNACNFEGNKTKSEECRLKQLKNEYKKVFFIFPKNRNIKRILWFYFNKSYTRLFNIKNRIFGK